MYSKIIRTVLYLLCCIIYSNVTAIDTLEYNQDYTALCSYSEFKLLERTSNISEAKKLENWSVCENDGLNFGNTSKAVWLKLNIKLNYDDAVLVASIPYLDHIELFQFSNNQLIKHNIKGDCYALPAEASKDAYPTFGLEKATTSIYLKVYTDEVLNLPLAIKPRADYMQEHKNRIVFYGVFIGVFSLMLLYNLILFISSGERLFLYYCFYLFIVFLMQMAFMGGSYELIYPNNPVWSKIDIYVFGSLLGILTAPFVLHFLEIKKHTPKMYQFCLFLVFLFASGIVLVLLDKLLVAFVYLNIVNLITTLTLLGLAIYLAESQFKARLFLFAWSIFLLGSIWFSLESNGIVPNSLVGKYAMPVGTILETLLLSAFLGSRIKHMKADLEAVHSKTSGSYQVEELQKMLQHSKLQTLRLKLNPHFLFNAMNSVLHVLKYQGTESSALFLSEYGQLMRATLSFSGNQYIGYEQEINFLKNYLNLEALRFNNRLEWEINSPNKLMNGNYKIPPMIIQPFVENALKHAYSPDQIHCTLIVDFIPSYDTQTINIKISDNGKGINIKDSDVEKESYGIKTIKERLKILKEVNPRCHFALNLNRNLASKTRDGLEINLELPLFNNYD